MKRIDLLHKMDGLLEGCKGCTKRSDPAPPDVKCKGCNVYPELREIGNQLGRKDKMAKFDMQVAEYVKLAEKMTKREMAKHLNISEGTLYAWINKNSVQIKPSKYTHEPDTAERQHPESKTTAEDKKAEYRPTTSEKELAVKLVDAEIEINELKQKVYELEDIHAACEDVESEIATLQEEKEKLDKLRIHNDYVMENQKYQLGQFAKENEELAEENKALKVIARRYLRAE